MAKIVIKNPPYEMVEALAYVMFTSVVSRSDVKVVVENDSNDSIVYYGSGFEFDGDVALHGTVTRVDIFAEGKLLATITDGRFPLAKLDFGYSDLNTILLTRGDDTVIGSSMSDYLLLETNKGDDVIKGMGGNDYITGSLGSNSIDGGAGDRDLLSYAEYAPETKLKSGIDADLTVGRIHNPFGKIDDVKNIERVAGTYLDDTIKGSKRDESLIGMDGNDRMTGRGGADTFEFYNQMFGDIKGRDKITDFGSGKDTITIGNYAGLDEYGDLKRLMSASGGDLLITLTTDEEILLLNTKKSDLKAADFDFVTF